MGWGLNRCGELQNSGKFEAIIFDDSFHTHLSILLSIHVDSVTSKRKKTVDPEKSNIIYNLNPSPPSQYPPTCTVRFFRSFLGTVTPTREPKSSVGNLWVNHFLNCEAISTCIFTKFNVSFPFSSFLFFSFLPPPLTIVALSYDSSRSRRWPYTFTFYDA